MVPHRHKFILRFWKNNMNSKIQEAITQGKNNAEEDIKNDISKKEKEFLKKVEDEKHRLLEDDYIYNLIRDAVRCRNSEVTLWNCRKDTEIAVNSIEGLKGYVDTAFDWDEGRHYDVVRVTWETK